MKWIVPLTFIVIAAAALFTILIVKILKPASGAAFLIFTAWLVLPYAVMSVVLILMRRKGTVSIYWYVMSAAVSIAGILYMSDVIFWHSDAQGGIAVLMTPILQGGASVLLLPIVLWLSRNSSSI